jgi:hypothetical protein
VIHRRFPAGDGPNYAGVTAPSAADLKFLLPLPQVGRNFKSQSGTGVLELLVPALFPKVRVTLREPSETGHQYSPGMVNFFGTSCGKLFR